ncbi:Hypothetical predicted protein [Olea europaea subsp. europaea]|uniref:Uncharacterized protein n=1 Tax=Olea europaea subsp. europaea TaxID=158383 RepID=A0A8S0VMR6_OLEEU|nr:Hypothetical predicted protein [Olea europaea subsp. europaea]
MTGIIREELGTMRREFTTEVVALREEIGVLRRDFTTEVVALRDEIGVLRQDLGELPTEVEALWGDVSGFRGSVRGSVGETGVPRDWWATAARFDEFFYSVSEPMREGVEVGSEVPEKAEVEVSEEVGMAGVEEAEMAGVEVSEEAEMIEGVEGGKGCRRER